MIERGWIKICGVTRPEDVETVIDAGANAIGFNLWSKSPRSISMEKARALIELVNGRIATVGVTVNTPLDQLKGLREELGLDWLQLHGDEAPATVNALQPHGFKAVGIQTDVHAREALNMPGPFILVDARDEVARGGTGQLAPTALARTIASRRPTVLAGGLTSQNVIQRIEEVRPHGVDTASGVETEPGVKDGEAVRAFCKCAKEAFASMANGECDV